MRNCAKPRVKILLRYQTGRGKSIGRAVGFSSAARMTELPCQAGKTVIEYIKYVWTHRWDENLDGFVSWLRQLQFDGVWQTALLVAASLLCITFHETCHGLAAYRLGDPTAKRAGRLTLNPLRHVDIGGLLMMALFRFGWAKPVPVDMRNFKHPKRDMALTAAAGPVSNVLLAYLAVLLRGLCSVWYYVSGSMAVYALALFFYYVEIISAGLAVFNVFPIPPLDGSKVLFSCLSDRAYDWLMRYERYGMALLTFLLLAGILDTPLEFLRDGLLNGLEAIGTWPVQLLLALR